MDAFWSSSLKPWDVSAGALLVTEAGGSMTRMNGDNFDHMLPDLLASNGSPIHHELRSLLAFADE
jgi:myo-inositol-1(or 4)-monophosphatase